MEIDIETICRQAMHEALVKGLKDRVAPSYGKGMFDGLFESVLKQREQEFRTLILQAIDGYMKDEECRKQIIAAMRSEIAKTLVKRFGGELEKQVNALKSDPATRARIVLALEQVVAEKSA